jgi:murein DD-endopeptidase MepM/ murein hydrolase activator NlpD
VIRGFRALAPVGLSAVLLTGLVPVLTPAATAGPAQIRYVFPLTCADVRYSRAHHDYPATDLFAKVGCPFVSPVDGVVDEVSRKDRWKPGTNAGATRGGLSVSIVGVDGVRYYGSHLSAIAEGIRRGRAVSAGQLLGRVGHSGDARYTTSHLHFGISWPTPKGEWWVRRGEIPPARYLDAWREGRSKSPARAVAAARHRENGDGACTRDC